jgi:hypothetical protein
MAPRGFQEELVVFIGSRKTVLNLGIAPLIGYSFL